MGRRKILALLTSLLSSVKGGGDRFIFPGGGEPFLGNVEGKRPLVSEGKESISS